MTLYGRTLVHLYTIHTIHCNAAHHTETGWRVCVIIRPCYAPLTYLAAVALGVAGPISIDLEDPGLSTDTKRLVEEEVLKMLNESYDRTRDTLRKYAKEHHMVRHSVTG